jgi:exosortase H (IPTLxxWG-CTERM-specific)
MKAGWRSGLLLVRIMAIFGLLIGAYYGFAATELYETKVFQPYVRINADFSSKILGLLGYSVVAEGDLLESRQFSLTIRRGCDGLEPTALFAAAVLAFSAPILLKLPALAIGIPLLAALNLVRIVSLFLVGIYYPDLLHTMHVDVWQVLYIVVGIALFALWLVWVTQRRGSPPPRPSR